MSIVSNLRIGTSDQAAVEALFALSSFDPTFDGAAAYLEHRRCGGLEPVESFVRAQTLDWDHLCVSSAVDLESRRAQGRATYRLNGARRVLTATVDCGYCGRTFNPRRTRDRASKYCSHRCYSANKAATGQPGKRPKLIEHNGVRLTMKGWAQRIGITTSVFKTRRYRGMSDAQIIECGARNPRHWKAGGAA